MSKPSKHRRLLLSECSAATPAGSCRRMRNLHEQNQFSFYRSLLGRDGDDNDNDGMRPRPPPWEMNWQCIHQRYVAPLLRATRSGRLRVASLDAAEAVRLRGFLILVVAALTTAVDRDRDSNNSPVDQESRYVDVSDLLRFLDQLHVQVGSERSDSYDDVTSAADDFTSVLKLCLAVDSAWHHEHDDVTVEGKDRFQREGAGQLQHMASNAIASALQLEHASAKDLVRYWCLAIVSWSRAASAGHKERCRRVLHQFVGAINETDALGRKPPNGSVAVPYINAAIAAVHPSIDNGNQLCAFEVSPRVTELLHESDAISTMFELFVGKPDDKECFDGTQNALAKLHALGSQADYDAAFCRCMIARQLKSNGSHGNASLEFVIAFYQTLVSTLLASSNEDEERGFVLTRVVALSMDSLLRSTELSALLLESVLRDKPHGTTAMRAVVKALVQLVLAPPLPSQRYSTTTCIHDVESLLCRDPRDCPEAAAARVLVAYLKVALQEHAGFNERSSNPPTSTGESRAESDGIPLDDAVNICLVLMDSKNDHVVEAVLSSFLCRLWQRDDAVGREILTKRPDILSSTASVVKRVSGNLVVGRALAKDVSESWLALCTCPDENFRSWVGYVLVRQETALSVLVSFCHDQGTSRAAVQTLLALSEEISNHRLLARQPGLVATLIRLVRDGVATRHDPMLGLGADTDHLFDREMIKQRILVLAEVL